MANEQSPILASIIDCAASLHETSWKTWEASISLSGVVVICSLYYHDKSWMNSHFAFGALSWILMALFGVWLQRVAPTLFEYFFTHFEWTDREYKKLKARAEAEEKAEREEELRLQERDEHYFRVTGKRKNRK